MIEMSTLLKSVKKLSVLYVEDDLKLQRKAGSLFRKIFKEVFVASKESEGLELFKELHVEDGRRIDIVVSDVSMFKMIEHIKDISDTHIVLLSAFDTPDSFSRAIELKVEHFLFKPLKGIQAVDLFSRIAKSIEDDRLIKSLLLEKFENSDSKREEHIFCIADACIFPIAIYELGEVKYATKSFQDLLSYHNSHKESVVKDDDRYISCFAQYDKNRPSANMIKLKQKVGNRIFRVVRRDINLMSYSKAYMYMLVDTTLKEYQKVKIESYLKSLQMLSIQQKKEILYLRSKSEKKVAKSEDSENSENILEIDDDIRSTLRKRHTHVMSASELVEGMDTEALEELQELDDLDNDMRDAMEPFGDNDFSTLPLVSELLLKYSKEIKALDEFRDLFLAVENLANLLAFLDIATIREESYGNFSLYLNSIREDLFSWRKNIFVEQNSDNIHYLDSSLFSTALHIELLVSGKEDISYDESDELEFF